MTPVEVWKGDGPVILGMPHTGEWIPAELAANLTVRGQQLSDTDWHIHRLYDGLLPDATTVRATFHRYVVDANRDPSGASLYPRQNTTGLVPLTDFDGVPLWKKEPKVAEIERRRRTFHVAYHTTLAAEMSRVQKRHGVAILYDCHSIRSVIPYLFDGTLPDFNIGTNGGLTCAQEIEASTVGICERTEGYSTVLNGRFKGGWTTRHYGRPCRGWHAIQMELAQSTYLKNQTAGWAYDARKAARLRPVLQSILETLAELASKLKG